MLKMLHAIKCYRTTQRYITAYKKIMTYSLFIILFYFKGKLTAIFTDMTNTPVYTS